ncbi:MAG: spore surface glycoprotein BclB, partial [Clostridia bacterium]
TDVQIAQAGIYQADFHCTIAVDAGTAIPASVQIQLERDGTAVPGATSTHTFSTTNEVTTMSFNIPFQTAGASTIRVVVNNAGFTFENVALTILKLGSTTP